MRSRGPRDVGHRGKMKVSRSILEKYIAEQFEYEVIQQRATVVRKGIYNAEMRCFMYWDIQTYDNKSFNLQKIANKLCFIQDQYEY